MLIAARLETTTTATRPKLTLNPQKQKGRGERKAGAGTEANKEKQGDKIAGVCWSEGGMRREGVMVRVGGGGRREMVGRKC